MRKTKQTYNGALKICLLSYKAVSWSATAHIMACPGGILISLGTSPFHKARSPSSAWIVLIAWTMPLYLRPLPWSRVWAISLVFTTSKGPVQTGPAVPARNPDTMDCHGWRTFPSPSCFCHRNTSKAFLALNIAAWFVPFRITVGAAPDQRPRRPSSQMIVRAQWIGPLYFRSSGLRPLCCCNLIFTTWNINVIQLICHHSL